MFSKVIKSLDYTIAARLIIAVTCLWFFGAYRLFDKDNENWIYTIESDGTGYYVYLPSVFIYHDLNHNYLKDQELIDRYNKHLKVYISNSENGKRYSKYYVGTSILILPFFLLAVIVSFLFGYPIDGFSLPFQLMVFLAALSYMLAGLSLISKFLKHLGLSNLAIAITIIAISLGTNALHYTCFEPSFSHIYAFFLVSLLLFLGQKYWAKPSTKLILYLALTLGLVIITRPTTIMALGGLALVFPTTKAFRQGLLYPFQKSGRLALFITSISVVVFIQFMMTFLQIGSFKIWTYTNEGFNFLNPEWFQFLFGYRKGLFIYSPVLFLTIPGVYFLWKKNSTKSFLFLGTFLLITYVLSSWWCWWFGGGFGSRSFIDFYPILTIPLSFFFHSIINWKTKFLAIPIAIPLVLISLVFQYQYRYHIIAWDEMNQDKFWQVFLRTNPVFKWSTTNYKTSIMSTTVKETSVYFSCNFDTKCSSFFEKQNIDLKKFNVISESGLSRIIDDNESFGAPFILPANEISTLGKNLLITYDCKMKIDNKATGGTVVCSVINKKEAWQGHKINRQIRKEKTWQKVHFEFQMKDLLLANDTLIIYTLNYSESPVWIDDVKIGIHALKK